MEMNGIIEKGRLVDLRAKKSPAENLTGRIQT